MRKRKPWKFIFILLFAVAISLGIYVYQQQYEPDDLFVKVGEGILDNAPEIFSGEPKEVRELRKQEVADTDTQGLRQEYYFGQLNEEEWQNLIIAMGSLSKAKKNSGAIGK